MYVPSNEHQSQCLESSSTVEENESCLCTTNPNKERVRCVHSRLLFCKLPALFAGSIPNSCTICVMNTVTRPPSTWWIIGAFCSVHLYPAPYAYPVSERNFRTQSKCTVPCAWSNTAHQQLVHFYFRFQFLFPFFISSFIALSFPAFQSINHIYLFKYS